MTRPLLALLALCLLTLVCAAFAHLNAEAVSIDFFFGRLHASLAEALIGAVIVGGCLAMIGALAWAFRLDRQRRELRQALKLAQAEARALRATAPGHAP